MRATAVLSVYLVILFALPTALGISPLGSSGAPATLAGLAAFLWWCWFHVNRRVPGPAQPQPVRWAIIGFLGVVLTAYIHGMYIPKPATEFLPADSALLRILAMSGLALVAHDGINSRDRMRALIRVLVSCLTGVALLSILQFFTGRIWVDQISIPGLARNYTELSHERQGLNRPSGTSTHPIEFATIMAMGLPLAIMYMRSARRIRLIHLLTIIIIFLANLLALSRTAIVCMAVGIIFIVPSLPRSWRTIGAIGMTGMIGLLGMTVPGLVGTLRGLFQFTGQDPSIISRTDSYELAGKVFFGNPWLGKGLGTFLPEYWILDNMYLQLLLEVGILGLLALLAMVATSFIAFLTAKSRLCDETDRHLITGLAAGLLAGTMSLAFFDAFAFPQSAILFYLLVGMVGAYRRLAFESDQQHVPAGTVR